MPDKKIIDIKAPPKKPTAQPPGGKVQAEKHTTIQTDRGEFKFREPKSQDWK